jgi:hypothetical protein
VLSEIQACRSYFRLAFVDRFDYNGFHKIITAPDEKYLLLKRKESRPPIQSFLKNSSTPNPASPHLVNPSRSDVGGVHPGSGRPLVELHHLLALLEQPEEGGDAADIKDVGADAHQVVQDSGQLGEHH